MIFIIFCVLVPSTSKPAEVNNSEGTSRGRTYSCLRYLSPLRSPLRSRRSMSAHGDRAGTFRSAFAPSTWRSGSVDGIWAFAPARAPVYPKDINPVTLLIVHPPWSPVPVHFIMPSKSEYPERPSHCAFNVQLITRPLCDWLDRIPAANSIPFKIPFSSCAAGTLSSDALGLFFCSCLQ